MDGDGADGAARLEQKARCVDRDDASTRPVMSRALGEKRLDERAVAAVEVVGDLDLSANAAFAEAFGGVGDRA